MKSKIYLTIIILLLSIISTCSPMITGNNLKNTDITEEEQKMYDTIAHLYPKQYDVSKLKQQINKKIQRTPEQEKMEKTQPTTRAPTINTGGLMNSSWPMKCHDQRHTGRSPYSTENVAGVEKWRFRIGHWIVGGISIDENGMLYLADHSKYVYCLFTNGLLNWFFEADDLWFWFSTPAIAQDGTLYVGSCDYGFYAINPNGTLKWRFSAGDWILSSPIIGDDGTIYFGTHWNRFYALHPNGTEQWHHVVPNGQGTSDPAIDKNGIIYVGFGNSDLYAFYPNGTIKWKFNAENDIQAPISIADDGTIYAGSYDGYLYAIHPTNGTMKWKQPIGIGTVANPSIATDGTIYTGCDKLYAINPNGTLKWDFYLGPGQWIGRSSPAISADGTIYVGTHINETNGGDIIAINPDGTEQWRKTISERVWVDSSPTIGPDGTVYIGSADIKMYEDPYYRDLGYIHAFGPVESNDPPHPPTIEGETNGKTNQKYSYTFTITDPDNNPVSLFIDWGDGETTQTSEYASGETFQRQHEWTTEGTYTIQAKTIDSLNTTSNHTTYTVIIFPEHIINKPQQGLYIMDKLIRTYTYLIRKPLIIGPLTITIQHTTQLPYQKVEYYIDNTLQYTDTTIPYQWTWHNTSSLKHHHTLKVTVTTKNSNMTYIKELWQFL